MEIKVGDRFKRAMQFDGEPLDFLTITETDGSNAVKVRRDDGVSFLIHEPLLKKEWLRIEPEPSQTEPKVEVLTERTITVGNLTVATIDSEDEITFTQPVSISELIRIAEALRPQA